MPFAVCPVCGTPPIKGRLSCHKCVEAHQQRERAMSDKRTVVQACRDLTTALASAKRDKEPAALPAIVNSFVTNLGGVDELGKMLVEDFNRLRGVGLDEEETKNFQIKEGVLQRFWQMVLRGIKSRDELVSVVDLEGFTDDELKAVLIPLAAEMMQSDKEFRATIFRDVVLHDPQMLEELLAEKSKVVTVEAVKPPAPAKAKRIKLDATEDVDPASLAEDE